MFVQIHMLQSVPPGNLNRDDTGQPKKCVFGGVTRGRISSQSLKRNIRLSGQFKGEFGDALADRTTYLPRMVVDELKAGQHGVPDDELTEISEALAKKFKSEGRASGPADTGDEVDGEGASGDSAPTSDKVGRTPQLVFFPQPFARRIADLLVEFRKENAGAYDRLLGRKTPRGTSNSALDAEIKHFVKNASIASNELTVDIGLFGRMTTSDLIVDVEAACQVAHAISTHEILIESDYFTAMDDLRAGYASTQSESAGAGFIGSGENENFFSAAVFYKYFNIDIDALSKHLPELSDRDVARVAAVFLNAAALVNPTGKQNSFAAHGITELILVEASESKRPMSYANAFLQAVEGGTGRNQMTESANAFAWYVDSVAAAYAPHDAKRGLLAVGHASSMELKTTHESATTLDGLAEWLQEVVAAPQHSDALA